MKIIHRMISGLTLSFLISVSVYAVPVKTDFVFIIDATGSMAGEISGVRNGFSTFVSNLNAATVDARFAVVVYGGSPELTLDFTSVGADAQTALNNITIGANPGIQNNHNVNPEAGLEAIRMVLGTATNSELVNNNIAEDGFLNFRNDARKNLILVTDEDSDTPFYIDNRFPSLQEEVDATAEAVIDNNAFLNMLISHNLNSEAQYGDYIHDVADANFLNFNSAETLVNLLADTATDESLQAQVLQAGLLARTFNVADANDSDFVTNFFAAKLEEVTSDDPCLVNPSLPQCNQTSVPEPATVALICLGLAGIRLGRSNKINFPWNNYS